MMSNQEKFELMLQTMRGERECHPQRLKSGNTSSLDTIMSESAKPRRALQNARFSKSVFYTHALYKIWHRCYMDKHEFGQKRIWLCQNDILQLCRSQGRTPSSTMYIVPKYPARPLAIGNAVLVDQAQRRYLLALWRMSRDDHTYTCYVSSLTH